MKWSSISSNPVDDLKSIKKIIDILMAYVNIIYYLTLQDYLKK